MYKFSYIFLMFIMYSFLGWIIEVIGSIKKTKKFINRGFLIGPYCPIYGVGVLLIIHFLKDYTASPIVLFILAMVICMVLEYLTSYIMEKLFKARWWDYNNRKFNINGRICLETTIPFGLGALLVMYIVNPFLEGLLNGLSDNTVIIIGIVCLVIFLTDLIVSLIVILKIKSVDISKYKDDTEVINKKVREYLMKDSALTRRLMESFPDASISIEKLKKMLPTRRNKTKK